MNRSLLLTIRIYLSWVVYMPIVGISYFIAWLDRKVRFKLSFPRDVEQLSQQKPWLIAELKQSGALPTDAVIGSCEVIPMDHATIFRSNAALVDIKYSINNVHHTLKCFAKFAPVMGSIWNKMIFNLQLNHIKEAWFNQYFVNHDPEVKAPKVYCSKVSVITGNLCLITELMSDDIEYKECAYDYFPQEHLDLALDGLASLHAKYWGDTSKRMEKVLPIDDITVHFFDSMVSGQWSIPARKVLVQSWIYMNHPQTVLHGDSRIGNMMFPSAADRGRYVLIDWQATRKGRAAFDLAYFLILSLISRHRKAVEPASIDSYYELLTAKGVKDYTRAALEEDYRHGCLATLVLLSLPMLSGEASVDGLAAQIFVYGMGVWHDRMRIKFDDFDYEWMADRYGMTAQQCRDGVSEMLTVIDVRLKQTLEKAGITETLQQLRKRNNIMHEYDV